MAEQRPQLFIKLKSENEDKSLFNDCGVSLKNKEEKNERENLTLQFFILTY
jgi:hypothetical protein